MRPMAPSMFLLALAPLALAALAPLALAAEGKAVTVTPDEQGFAARFAATRLSGETPGSQLEPGLTVLANHDAPSLNARQGKPLLLAGKSFERGVYCHAPSRILVRLPGPGATFTALVGVDSNSQTSGGRGSVDFAVSVAGGERFRSGTVREGMPPAAVKVPLDGATEFLLQVDTTPDGIACDQADWAEAKVALADGRELWLGDLPLRDDRAAALLAGGPPFSFVYGGKPSSELLPTWKHERRGTEQTWTDPATGLRVRLAGVAYPGFPTVEWTVHFTNTGEQDTPLLEQVQALAVDLNRPGGGEYLLHHNVGSPADGNDFSPRETVLGGGSTTRFGGAGGRSTNQHWSYFNLESPHGDGSRRGVVLAVGWPGQWAAEFARDVSSGLRVRAGMELTHLRLHPGESIRTPSIVLQFWQGGDWLRGQNVWRRWTMAHSMPRPGGELPRPQFVASSSRQYAEMIEADEANQKAFIDRYEEEGLKLDYWWMDAGWYIHNGAGWPHVGTWEVDPARFPGGLRPISDYAKARGFKTLLWFEPERVSAGTWLADNHPEWVLGGKAGGLLDLGNDEARKWLIEHIDSVLTKQGIGLYRQDFNMDPLGYWRGHDAEDRQGITEIRHCEGLLAYWDELHRRHPDMLIDDCASGGRRLDLECARRAVPLWRSDYAFEPIGHQCMMMGLSTWLPYHGTGTVACANAGYYGGGRTPVEPYAFWSNAGQSLGSGIDVRDRGLDYPALRRLYGQWRQVNKYYYGDFYPLTPVSRDATVWAGWQFDRPEQGDGMVQVFRRQDSFYEAGRLKLRGLDAAAKYTVTDLDAHQPPRMLTGAELAAGLLVTIGEQPGVRVLVYERAGA
ncbi:MAG: alpha-galactosidase [Armatimonadetes bacterium]|nr:alpha-galactosidase [Armatimonadota bacterium]